MSNQQWTAVDDYMSRPADPTRSCSGSRAARISRGGLAAIQVAPNQGKLLAILAQAIGARRILEIGTLGDTARSGWPRRSRGGSLITLEADRKHAEVSRGQPRTRRSGGACRAAAGRGPGYAAARWRPKHASRSTLSLSTPTSRTSQSTSMGAEALAARQPDHRRQCRARRRRGRCKVPTTLACRACGASWKPLAADPRVTATAIQTVGTKGYDGLAIAVGSSSLWRGSQMLLKAGAACRQA